MGGFARARGAEQIAPRRQGQPPIVGPRIIIKPERHSPGADADPSVDLGVVGRITFRTGLIFIVN